MFWYGHPENAYKKNSCMSFYVQFCAYQVRAEPCVEVIIVNLNHNGILVTMSP